MNELKKIETQNIDNTNKKTLTKRNLVKEILWALKALQKKNEKEKKIEEIKKNKARGAWKWHFELQNKKVKASS